MQTIATTASASDSASEAARLAKLLDYQILDTAPEQEFDEVTEIAAKLLGTPISLVSLIDKDRQWFKARYGLGAAETPRDQAFCDHAIKADDLYIVNNAAEDPLFAANPLVTGHPNIRFYAGAPLITPDKFRLGTLCVIDTAPREGLAEEAQRILTLLAKMVVNQMESRRNTVRAKHQARMMSQLAEHTVALAQAKDMAQLAALLTDSARRMVVADAAVLRAGEQVTAATREGMSGEPPPALPWRERSAALRARKTLKPATLKDLPAPENAVIKGAWMGFLLGLDAQNPRGDFQMWRQFTTSFTDMETAMLTDLVRVAGAVAERLPGGR
ncbi:MAG: GAF domain-containing protein [Rhodospirillaceae bacterium]|nr:GAF domain-containing protein [Rhodospirillaceae bacterium]